MIKCLINNSLQKKNFKEILDLKKRQRKISKTKDIKQVYKNLFVSNYYGVQRLKKLNNRNIDVIINLESLDICKNHFIKDFKYLNFPLIDNGAYNI